MSLGCYRWLREQYRGKILSLYNAELCDAETDGLHRRRKGSTLMMRSEPDLDNYSPADKDHVDAEALAREMRHACFNLERALSRRLTSAQRSNILAALDLLRDLRVR